MVFLENQLNSLFGKLKIIEHTVANTEFHQKYRNVCKVKGGEK